jgi:Protein of unknown function (DUF3570)
MIFRWNRLRPLACLALVTPFGMNVATASELPEDHVQLNYVRLDGGGDGVAGPGLLVSKRLGQTLAFTANYVSEHVVSAPVDLFLADSRRLDETRRIGRLDLDLNDDRTSYTVGVTRSTQDSYVANTAHAEITESLFSDLTTVTLGASRGWDSAYRILGATGSRDPLFEGKSGQRSWALSLTQTLTQNLSAQFEGEVITQEGYLASPNRAARVATTDGYALVAERTPGTRTRDVAALHFKYYLPWRAAVTAGGRYHSDTWGVRARDWDLAYRQPLRHDRWVLEVALRHYGQSHADFYSDLSEAPAAGYLSRDRTLAEFKSDRIGVTADYTFATHRLHLKKLTGTIGIDGIRYRYADFRDPFAGASAGGVAPLYQHSALLAQAQLTGWF